MSWPGRGRPDGGADEADKVAAELNGLHGCRLARYRLPGSGCPVSRKMPCELHVDMQLVYGTAPRALRRVDRPLLVDPPTRGPQPYLGRRPGPLPQPQRDVRRLRRHQRLRPAPPHRQRLHRAPADRLQDRERLRAHIDNRTYVGIIHGAAAKPGAVHVGTELATIHGTGIRSSLITATVTTTAKPAAVTDPRGPPRIAMATSPLAAASVSAAPSLKATGGGRRSHIPRRDPSCAS
jgi:hypothetical protein